jgi:glyoxylase-like metal-dependent hydrolase (beta-lactamase superfamily II)
MISNHSLTQYQTSSGFVITRLPLEAFPNFWAYAYLVQVDDWNVLIDTGSGSDVSNEELENGFTKVGVSITELTHILLTHGHIDHYGGLGFLRERTNAKIGVHELDLGTVTMHESRLALLGSQLDTFLARGGIPDERRAELLNMYRFTKKFHHSIPVDFTYKAQDMRVGPFEIIHVPGHCAGHVAIKLDDVVFCGDLVLEEVTPHQSPEELLPFMGVHHYLESLSVFECWASDATLILNGHDDPIENLSERISVIRANLFQRVEQVQAALSEPCTIAQITTQVYGERNGYNALLVLEKIGAYIEYLVQRGLVEIANADELEANPLAAIKYCRIKRPKQQNVTLLSRHETVM